MADRTGAGNDVIRPRYRHPERSMKPGNLAEAEAMGSGLTPLYGDSSDLMLDVETTGRRTASN